MAHQHLDNPDKYDASIDAFKGLLIILIVLGHNPYFSRSFFGAFEALYKFHVASFLLLPFIFPVSRPTFIEARDITVRYLVPHYLFFYLACILYFSIFIHKNYESILQWFSQVMLASLLASQGLYKQACGFHLFWFLPALLVLALIRICYIRSSTKLRIYLLGLSLLDHFCIGIYQEDILQFFPYSISLVLYVFPLGLLVCKAINYSRKLWFILTNCIAFLFSIYLGNTILLEVAFAGGGAMYPVFDLSRFILQDLYLTSGFFTLLSIARLIPLPPLVKLGKRTMIIFLLHSFVQQAFIQSGLANLIFQWIPKEPIAILVLFLLTIGLSYFTGDALQRFPRLNGIILPRNWNSWKIAISNSNIQ